MLVDGFLTDLNFRTSIFKSMHITWIGYAPVWDRYSAHNGGQLTDWSWVRVGARQESVTESDCSNRAENINIFKHTIARMASLQSKVWE